MSTAAKDAFLFVGTYTEKEGSQSRGIHVYRLDLTSGALTFVREAGDLLNPSYLAFHPQKPLLYAVNEVQRFGGQAGGGVTALSVDPASGELKVLNAGPSQGEDPCYISVEQTGRFALVANYSGGNAALLPILENGGLGAAGDVVWHAGSSVHPERQTGPHVHCILPDPTDHFAIAVDLGLDQLLVYEMDVQGGRLKKHGEVNVQPGAGPRHLTFHPNGTFAYLINELNSTLIGYRFDSEAGSFEELQTVPALPPDFTGENLSADIHVSPDGMHLYASNRGHDSIVCYSIDAQSGRLRYRHHTSTGGKEPRNFAIDPTGNFLFAANQSSNAVVAFKIDRKSGDLYRTGHVVEISMPVCLKFSPLHSREGWK